MWTVSPDMLQNAATSNARPVRPNRDFGNLGPGTIDTCARRSGSIPAKNSHHVSEVLRKILVDPALRRTRSVSDEISVEPVRLRSGHVFADRRSVQFSRSRVGEW